MGSFFSSDAERLRNIRREIQIALTMQNVQLKQAQTRYNISDIALQKAIANGLNSTIPAQSLQIAKRQLDIINKTIMHLSSIDEALLESNAALDTKKIMEAAGNIMRSLNDHTLSNEKILLITSKFAMEHEGIKLKSEAFDEAIEVESVDDLTSQYQELHDIKVAHNLQDLSRMRKSSHKDMLSN